MNRHELDALIQGALDHALTPDEQARLAQVIDESPEARARVAQFAELAHLLESLDDAGVPPRLVEDVVARISHHPPHVSKSTFPRGVAVNKKILFGLAAAAVIVLAVITYSTNPPATVGTEATIGAAQRAQAPQIAPSDVKLGDASAQDVLQTETFDAIMRDDALRTMLQDAELRKHLQEAGVRQALKDPAVKKALNDPNMARRLQDEAMMRALVDPAVAKKFADDENLRALSAHQALARSLQDQNFKKIMMRAEARAALTGAAMARALNDPNFEAALKGNLSARLAANARK
jgi:hypothetical protein